MKKLLILSCLMIFALIGQAQTYTVTVTGTLTGTDGIGIPNADVHISNDSLMFGNWMYSNTVTTDGGGIFTDVIDVPDTEPFGILLLETDDCNGGTLHADLFFGMDITDISLALLYCDTIGNPPLDSCFASVHCDPAGNLVADAFGIPPFTYAWNTGETTEVITPQDTGLYCVTVTDAVGCVADACSHFVGGGGNGWDSCFVFIYESFDSTGALVLTAENLGAGPYTYTWDDGQGTQSITPSAPGVYCVTSADAAGCVSTACYDYNSNPWGDTCLVFIYEDNRFGIPLTVLTAQNVGPGPHTYVWDNGDTTQSITPDTAGTYCVVSTDAAGCTSTACYDYDSNPWGGDTCLVFIYENWDSTGNGINGLTAQNIGPGPHTYVWDNGETTQTITPDSAATYCVVSTDATGCTSTACYDYMTNPWGDTCGVYIYCDPNGLFSANAFGQAPFTYQWSTGENSQTIMPVDTGDYCVTVTDATGCVASSCYYFGGGGNGGWDSCFVYIYEDWSPNGVTGLTAENFGPGPHSYVWNTGETTQSIIPSGDGEYCVTSTDVTGCTSTACYDYVSNPWGDSCFVSVTSGFAGDLFASAIGVPPFTYLWNTGETTEMIMVQDTGLYCVTVTDATGCVSEGCAYGSPNPWDDCRVEIIFDGIGLTAVVNDSVGYSFLWDSGETTQTIYPQSTGLYCVTIINDATGCAATACYFYDDGSIDTICSVVVLEFSDTVGFPGLFAFGTGVEPFTYQWDTGDTTQFIPMPIDASIHCVTITDATGCVAVGCQGIDPNLPQSSRIAGNIYTIDSTQFPVFITGTVDLIDALSGDIVLTTDVLNLNGIPFYDFGDVASGTYLVRATVSNPNGNNFIPTYHFTTTLSGEADEINVPFTIAALPFGNSFDILIYEVQLRPGKGSIAGNVTKEGKFGAALDGRKGDLEGISIVLFDDSHNVLNYFSTDASGNFSFPDLAYGTYEVYIDIPGRNNAFFTVTLSEDTPDISDLTFDISDERISTWSGTSAVEEPESINDFRVFPNPASGSVNVEITGNDTGEVALNVLSISGVTMISEKVSLTKATQKIRLDLKGLTTGIYFVRITEGRQTVSKKLIVR